MSDQSQEEAGRRTARGAGAGLRRRLARLYALALGLVVLLVLGADQVARSVAGETEREVRRVHVATRQPVLSLKVVTLVERLAETGDRWERQRLHAEARAALDLLMKSHEELDRTATSTAIRAIHSGPRGLSAKIAEFAALANAVWAQADRAVDREHAMGLRNFATSRLLPMQERAARQTELDVRAALDRLVLVQRGLFAGIVLLLLVEWLVLFRPHAHRLARQGEELALRLGQLQEAARRDPLTGLPNRRFLGEFLEALWPKAVAAGHRVAALHVDLDRFKHVNDLDGHAAGDAVLRRVGEILSRETRRGDLVARVGGDEFVIVLPEAPPAEGLAALSERVLARIGEPITLGAMRVRIGASIGHAEAEPGRSTPEALLLDADFALHAAKRAGRGRHLAYSPEMRLAETQREILREDLLRALEEDQFLVEYQPQVDLVRGSVAGFEALLRWNHPSRGRLTPPAFLGVAEESGLIDRIGRAAIGQALDAHAAWRREGLVLPRLGLNLSAAQIRDAGFVEWLRWEVDRREIPPETVALELLETVLVGQGDDAVVRHVQALAGEGFHIDLDDFGTGHASIVNLLRFKVHRIKIDRSFVSGIDRSPAQQRLTGAMLSMAQAIGIAALAEGLETEAEAATLRGLGCAQAQGYLISRPLSAPAARHWLAERSAAPGRLAAAPN